MSLFGRSYPTPILRPMAPFILAASIVWLTVNKIENWGQSQPPYDYDPRNSKALLNKKLKEQQHH